VHRRTAILAGAALLATALVALTPVPAAAAVPAGFEDELVVGVSAPTALAFTDGRMLVTSQGGTVRVVKHGSLLPTPALDLTATTCSNSERGLLGIAVDPAFATNGFVFVYHSVRTGALCDDRTINRVTRFVMTGDTLGGGVVLIDNIPSPAGNHNAGDLQFGKDGLLYVSVGDGGCDYPGGTPSGCGASNDAARDEHVLLGKILRVDRNGGIPPSNPFQGAGTARCNVTGRTTAGQRCQETFAWGLRNPFRMAFDPNATGARFHINDVGQATWEEIDLGIAGADYGWNVREGFCATGSTTNCGPPPAGMTNPIFAYGRSDGCRSITGGAFVPAGTWPAEYQGKYLFSDFACGKIFRLNPDGSGGFTRVDFATGLGGNSAVHLAFGPWSGTQALYYTTYASGGQVRRIVHPASIPPSEVTGFTWYADGSATASGPAGTVVTAYATGLRRSTTFVLVTTVAEADPLRRCTRDPRPVNAALRFSNNAGFVGRTTGPIDRPPGQWDVCFKPVDGPWIGAPVRFTVR
jgi:glucose/arabinose dehydrogenase